MKKIDVSLNSHIPSGDVKIKPFIVIDGKTLFPDSFSINENKTASNVHLSLEYNCGLREDVFIQCHSRHVVCRRRTVNHSEKVVKLNEIGVSVDGIQFGGARENDYLYHLENPRIYSKMAVPVDAKRSETNATDGGYDAMAGNRWADPGVVSDRIGASPYQPFPAILLSNHEAATGLAHGTLSQRCFYHNYLVGHRGGSVFLDVCSSFKALAFLEMEPGRTLDDVWYLGGVENARDLSEVFSEYIDVLREHLPPMYGSTNINRHSLVWGSWNDGIFRDVDQARLLRNAAFIADHFPTVKWMQIDDGYAALSDEIKSSHGLGMPYEGETGVARTKFPDGLKAFTDKVREKGLRPAVWIGGHISNKAKLARENPDWGVDYSFRIKDRMVLDVSKSDVREYMKKALDFFFVESGFEGMKHDFWSYVFEDSHDLLTNKGRSGYEWRDWWLKEIRRRLPADGYLQTGCDIVMANPFLGERFTNYRYGIDIGNGNWDNVKTNFQWGAACFALRIGDLFVPNSDSVGVFPGLSDEEAMLCVNYCLISRSMVEIAGWLYEEERNPRFNILKKAVCCPNNGQDVFFADYDYRSTDMPPTIWFFQGPHFSLLENAPFLPLRTVAIFNLDDDERDFTLNLESLRLSSGKCFVTDVWSNSTRLINTTGAFRLNPHSSVLLAVNADNGDPQLLDSDFKVDAIDVDGNAMNVTFAFTGAFNISLSRQPSKIDGCSIVEIKRGEGNWMVTGALDGERKIRITF